MVCSFLRSTLSSTRCQSKRLFLFPPQTVQRFPRNLYLVRPCFHAGLIGHFSPRTRPNRTAINWLPESENLSDKPPSCYTVDDTGSTSSPRLGSTEAETSLTPFLRAGSSGFSAITRVAAPSPLRYSTHRFFLSHRDTATYTAYRRSWQLNSPRFKNKHYYVVCLNILIPLLSLSSWFFLYILSLISTTRTIKQNQRKKEYAPFIAIDRRR